MRFAILLIMITASFSVFSKYRRVSSFEPYYYACKFNRLVLFETDNDYGKEQNSAFNFPAPGDGEYMSKKSGSGNYYRFFSHELILDFKGNAVLKIEEGELGHSQDLKFKVENYKDRDPPPIKYEGSVDIQGKGKIEYKLSCEASNGQ